MADVDESATFTFDLGGNLKVEAASQTEALEKLRGSLASGSDELRGMQKALRNLKGDSSVSEQTLSNLRDQIVAQKGAISKAQAAYLQLGGSFGQVKTQSLNATGGLQGLGSAVAEIARARAEQALLRKGSATELLSGKLRSALGPLGQFLGDMAKIPPGTLLAGAAVGVVAIALAALTAVTVGAIVSLARYGVAVADARRSELLRLEGLTKIRNFWGGFNGQLGSSAAQAGFLQSQIDSVSASVAIGRDKVSDYASQLYKMGLRGGNLQAALQGVATTAAVQGDAQAQAFAGWAAGAAMTGQSVKRLAQDVQSRLGGIARAQLLSLDVQSQKLHESFAMLFSGLKIDTLLQGIAKVTELFSQSTASGRALKSILTALVQPLINGVTAAALPVRRFFQGIIIGALLVGIGVKKLGNLFRDTFGGAWKSNLDLSTAALFAGGVAALTLASALGVAALAAGLLLLPVLLVVAAFAVLGAAAYGAYELWKSIDWTSLGTGIVTGIVGGISSGAKWVWDAMSNLASGTWKAFRAKLDIHSPSRLFKRDARDNIGGAVAGGLDDAKPAVDRSARGLVDIPERYAAEAPGGAGAGGARSSGAGSAPQVTVTVGDIVVHAASGESMTDAVRREVESIFEGVAITLGARVAGQHG